MADNYLASRTAAGRGAQGDDVASVDLRLGRNIVVDTVDWLALAGGQERTARPAGYCDREVDALVRMDPAQAK